MEDTTAKQLVVRPGGSINKNRLTENVQLFGEDGAPFEFEGGGNLPDPPSEGTYVLESVDGILSWEIKE